MDDQYLHPNPSDELLAARVVLRDVEAFTELYDRYARPVYAMTAHMLGSTDADEIVQDVFLRFWNKAEQFDPERGSFKSWFMTIARHRVLDELRARSLQQRFIATEATDQMLANAEDPMIDVEREVWSRERGRAVLRALKTLPAEQRQVLILAYFGGLSQSAIAQRLGWPLGTVKKRIRLGLQKLRAAIGPQEMVVADQSISTDVTS